MSSDYMFLDAAASIGRRIVDEAIWHDGRCNWVGAVRDTVHPWRPVYRALEPNLYDGTAGVALFLAHLAAVTDDSAARRTAVGAMRQAVARAPAIPPDRRDGFHAGTLGIAWAAARGGVLLGNDELHTGAVTLSAMARPSSARDRRPDVASGSGGSMLALLTLADMFDDPALLQGALAIGEELVGRATVTHHGWGWAIAGRRHRHPLCGLSHGAGGVGWALLELFAATGDERFRAGAIAAFAYERSWLDPRSGTWPDLRIGGQQRAAARRAASPSVGAWCHGEGGIALTRLRALELLDSAECRQDAEFALEATRRQLAADVADEVRDLSLCHGSAGSADVLICAGAALGGRWREAEGLAPELGHLMLERYGDTGEDWPCGAAAGTTPGLFRGLSGIGWWFLRLHDRAIPSPLLMPSRR